MSHAKKNFIPWRYAVINMVLGFSVLLYPYLLLKNFAFALCYIFLLSSFSSFNVFCANKCDRFRKPDIRILTEEFNFSNVLVILTMSISIYHVGAIIFGAPLFESFRSTLYFSVLMTIFTAYPLLWYFFFTDSITAVLKLLSESKFDSFTENQLHIIIIGTVLGAWIGAIPIPLDWDRPWQTWPITCCIGASIGNSASHFIIGLKHMYSYHKDRKKVALNRSV